MNISYGRQFISSDDIKNIISACKSEKITQGEYVKKFENDIQKKFKAKYCAALNSGTSALFCSLKSLCLEKEYKVVTSPITFFSSVYTILMNNLAPDFCDINLENYNLDLNKLEDKLKKDKLIKAVIAVDYAGHPCDWKSLSFLKKKYGIYLINDNCHAIGAKLNNDIGYATRFADLVTQSYHPVKNITTGEGGSVLTNNKKLYDIILNLRNHGIIRNDDISEKYGPWFYKVKNYGFNLRISDILCALGSSQIKKLEKFILKRKLIAKEYNKAFKNIDFNTKSTRFC